jgi:hypothetical protein
MYICICVCVCVCACVIYVYNTSRLRVAMYIGTRISSQASTYTRTRARDIIGGAALQRPRRIERHLERVRHVARRRAEAAHTASNVVTRAVFQAPMAALKAGVLQNACEPDDATVGGGAESS